MQLTPEQADDFVANPFATGDGRPTDQWAEGEQAESFATIQRYATTLGHVLRMFGLTLAMPLAFWFLMMVPGLRTWHLIAEASFGLMLLTIGERLAYKHRCSRCENTFRNVDSECCSRCGATFMPHKHRRHDSFWARCLLAWIIYALFIAAPSAILYLYLL